MVQFENTHVPDKVYGFTVQNAHILYALINLSERDGSVSVEVLDDIATHEDSTELIQVKATTSSNNPVSNHAIGLWKTFYNWLLAVKSSTINPDKTFFQLFLNAPKKGQIILSFSSANEEASAKTAYENAYKAFYGKQKPIPTFIETYISELFSPSNKDDVIKIIQHFSFSNITSSYSEWIRKEFLNKTSSPPELVDDLLLHMLGWIKKKILDNEGKAFSIEKEEYIKEYSSIYRKLNHRHMLQDLALDISEEDIDGEKKALRKYIEQLEIIEVNNDSILEAINNYLKASINRTKWSKRGLITYNSCDAYEKELKSNWLRKKEIVDLDENEPIKQGKKLYLTCSDLNLPIDGIPVPYFFTPGAFHKLADTLEIGWHPDYKKIIGG